MDFHGGHNRRIRWSQTKHSSINLNISSAKSIVEGFSEKVGIQTRGPHQVLGKVLLNLTECNNLFFERHFANILEFKMFSMSSVSFHCTPCVLFQHLSSLANADDFYFCIFNDKLRVRIYEVFMKQLLNKFFFNSILKPQ